MAAAKTVKIKLLTGLAGNRLDEKQQVRSTFTYQPGTTVDWPADEAQRLVERGYAEYAGEAK